MKYILLANNSTFKTKVKFDKEDILVMFNYLFPLKNLDIQNHQNKMWILRINQLIYKNINGIAYAGYEMLESYQSLFKQICFYDSPRHINEPIQTICQNQIKAANILQEKIIEIDTDVKELKKDIAYPKYKSMSTGLIIYGYLKKTQPEVKIVLAGFTSEINKSYHHASWERRFFEKEYKIGGCDIIW